ncbi:MAG: ATP-grasp domain-containing protein [Bacteroidales bacterium]|jgi:biotin carboxylase|nr:ATP-grasp domain-containing protein [Bacteroidales bacterium]
MDIKGKKLLILGANAITCEIVNAAKALGVYTIATDYNPVEKAPAKLIADEYWNDSIMDYDVLLPKIKEHKVDGILTGFIDIVLLPYQHLCELAGLPCYATKEVFETTMDKAKFKKLCRDNGVTVIPEYDLDTFDPNVINEKNKVIIKPVDNSGSRGVIICGKPEDFSKCLDYAMSFSKKKQVVIEKYMELDSVSASYNIQDGVISLSTFNDRYVHKSPDGGAVTCLSLYPSKYLDDYMEKMNEKVCAMYRNLGVRNGLLSLQFFTDGNDFYVMEMGHRLTGGQHYMISKAENGISSLDQLIHFAVTGKMADFSIAEKDNARFKNVYCHLYILGKEAKIARFEGLDYLKNLPEVIHFSQMKRVGDTIGPDGTSAQKVVGLHLKVKDRDDLNRILRDIQQKFHFYDEEGNDLKLEVIK